METMKINRSAHLTDANRNWRDGRILTIPDAALHPHPWDNRPALVRFAAWLRRVGRKLAGG